MSSAPCVITYKTIYAYVHSLVSSRLGSIKNSRRRQRFPRRRPYVRASPIGPSHSSRAGTVDWFSHSFLFLLLLVTRARAFFEANAQNKMLCSAKHLRFARANVATTTTSTSRVDVAVARKAVIRSRGRTGRVSTRASGDDGEGRGQDVQNDWDGAWRAFKRDFVGEDAKMPGDYVETKFKSKRCVWTFSSPFFSRVGWMIARVRARRREKTD